MSRIIVEAATMLHVERMAPRLRAGDTLEMARLGMGAPLEGLVQTLDEATVAWCASRDGEPLALWGVRFGSLSTGHGYVSCWTAEGAARPVRPFLEGSRWGLSLVTSICPRLFTLVDAEYPEAVRWMRWLGFHLHGPVPVGPAGHPFYAATLGMGG